MSNSVYNVKDLVWCLYDLKSSNIFDDIGIIKEIYKDDFSKQLKYKIIWLKMNITSEFEKHLINYGDPQYERQF